MSAALHITVLLEEAVEALAIKPDGVYVDGTFGRGGHSRAVLARLGPNGKLIAFDRDPVAVAAGEALKDPRFELVHAPFSDFAEALAERGVVHVDGVLLDLGVSSPQLDEAERGMSFRFDAPLDMRMDTSRGFLERDRADRGQALRRIGASSAAIDHHEHLLVSSLRGPRGVLTVARHHGSEDDVTIDHRASLASHHLEAAIRAQDQHAVLEGDTSDGGALEGPRALRVDDGEEHGVGPIAALGDLGHHLTHHDGGRAHGRIGQGARAGRSGIGLTPGDQGEGEQGGSMSHDAAAGYLREAGPAKGPDRAPRMSLARGASEGDTLQPRPP